MRYYGYPPANSSSIAKSSATCCSYSSVVNHRENGKIPTHRFLGKKDDEPFIVENWLERIERMLRQMHCTPEENLECATSLLQDEAY